MLTLSQVWRVVFLLKVVGLNLEKKITIVVGLMTILAIISGLIVLMLLGVSLHYHPRPKAESFIWLSGLVAASVMPVAISWILKLRLIKWQWLKSIFLFLLFAFGGFLAFYMGQETLTDRGDFFLWFPLCIYGILMISTAFLLINREDC